MMRQTSLKRRMVLSITALVAVMTAVMVLSFVTIGQNLLASVETKGVDLSKNVLLKHTESATKALESKARNLATFYAKLAVVPMQTFDTETLNENVQMIYSDEDVVLCVATDKTGKVLTRDQNTANPFVQRALADLPPEKKTLAGIVEKLAKDPTVLLVETPILQAKNELGKVQLIVSKQQSAAQAAELEGLFTGFKTSMQQFKVEEGTHAAQWIIGIALIALFVMVIVVTFIANSITQPISVAVQAAERVASGDLTTHIKVPVGEKQDETGQLLGAIDAMTCNLNSLVSHVKHSSIQLVSTATGIAANVKQQQAAVSDFGSSTTEIAAAAKQISATSRELLQTMNEVSIVAGDTASLADTGRNNLREMESTIGQLGHATQSISTKLSAIREKADEINVVVTTITKVADQTNLLSLNASIEAEKAGEYGLGFAVVAREIRRLADQTAVATLDIEQMVKEMQAAVSAGVMEMDRFARDVQRGVEEVARIGTQQGGIIERVQTLPPRFKQVNEGMQAQAQGAGQISDAMVQLNDGAQRTVSTLDEFSKAASDLHAAVNTLKEEVARFRIGS